MNEYEINDFGEASFVYEKKGFRGCIKCYGTIRAIEKKVVLFFDNDDYEYLIHRKDFKFEKKPRT